MNNFKPGDTVVLTGEYFAKRLKHELAQVITFENYKLLLGGPKIKDNPEYVYVFCNGEPLAFKPKNLTSIELFNSPLMKAMREEND